MNHTFDVDIATQYGVNAAIVFQDMGYWCEHSRINRKNYHDGLYWTFNSISALSEHYPYMSSKAIRTAIQKLVDGELLTTGNFNKKGWDRTLWYALTQKGESIFRKGKMDSPKTENPNSQNGEPIPYTIPDTETNTTTRRNRRVDVISPGFTEFWNAYPRKVAKQNALKAWGKTGADDSQSITSTILADVKRRVDGEWKGKEVQYIPHPATYLNQRRWEDETTTGTVESEPEQTWRDLSPEEQREMEDRLADEYWAARGK